MRRLEAARPRPARILPLLCCAVALAACRDCDPQAVAIAPQIYLDSCADPQREVQGKLIGGFRECAYDFGDVDISVKVMHDIVVTNPSIVELIFTNVAIVEGDPAFKVELAPERIGPGLSGVITVSVRPKVEAPIAAVLSILSDANNTDQTAESLSLVEVQLTANGVDNGVPDIKVTPLDCDFGRVAQGGVQVCPVAITNEGNRGLVLDSVAFIPPTDAPDATLFDTPPDSVRNGGTDGVCDASAGEEECAFAFTGRPPGPTEEIAPNGGTVVLSARFTPDVLGNFSGKFRILSNDPDEEQIDVTLGGISVTPPMCAIRIKSVNGVDVPPGGDPEIEPLDNVILTLEDSTPSTIEGSIAAYEWAIPANGRPAGSTVQLVAPTAETTGFTFDDDLGIDLAGTYTVRAVVYDELGTTSVNECELSFEAIPKDHFLVQLSWDTATNDIDLHTTKQAADGSYCISSTSFDTVVSGLLSEDCDNDLDCNYAGCKSGSFGTAPEWDGEAGRTAGDPMLDIDDLSGFGPENINVDAMAEGNYLVGVDSYSMSQPSGVTVRIFIFGRLAAEFFAEIDDGDWFEAAVVHWPADPLTEDPCIEDLTDGDAIDDCG